MDWWPSPMFAAYFHGDRWCRTQDQRHHRACCDEIMLQCHTNYPIWPCNSHIILWYTRVQVQYGTIIYKKEYLNRSSGSTPSRCAFLCCPALGQHSPWCPDSAVQLLDNLVGRHPSKKSNKSMEWSQGYQVVAKNVESLVAEICQFLL